MSDLTEFLAYFFSIDSLANKTYTNPLFMYLPSLGNFLLETAICIEEAIHVTQYIYYILERNLPKVWTLVLRRMLHTFTWDHNKVTCTAASFLLDYLVLEVASKLLN